MNTATITFGVISFGDHSVYGGVRLFAGDQAYSAMAWELTEVFFPGGVPGDHQHHRQTLRGLDLFLKDALQG